MLNLRCVWDIQTKTSSEPLDYKALEQPVLNIDSAIIGVEVVLEVLREEEIDQGNYIQSAKLRTKNTNI